MRKRIRVLAPSLLLVAALMLTSCGFGPAVAKTVSPTAPAAQSRVAVSETAVLTATTSTAPSVVGSISSLEDTFVAVYQVVNPSVVNVRVTLAPSGGRNAFPQLTPRSAQGSGFVWDNQGDIVTNNHVVEGATTIEVTFYDDVTVSATLVGRDPDSDLAVIKVDPSLHELAPVRLADFQSLKVGQIALAIGNPFGLNGTLTSGIISALGRDLPVGSTTGTQPQYSIPDVIQTDAAVNPGNSGGPLLNAQGEVIGVNTAIESSDGSNSGVGFAVPVSIVQRVVPALVKDGTYRHPWLGVTVTSLRPEVAKAMDLQTQTRGALVISVTKGGPAEKAGLKPGTETTEIDGQQLPVGGDVIVEIDGKTVSKSEDLISYLVRETFVGQEVSLVVLREGQRVTVKAVLAPRPSSQASVT